MIFFLAVMLALPWLAWLPIAQTRRIKWIVTFVLAGWAALAIGIVAALPRVRAEVTLAYLPMALTIVWIGRRTERRELGLTEARSAVWAMRILLVVATIITCFCGGFAFYTFNSAPFMPSTGELLPLPQGLHATDITGGRSDSCGTGTCTRRFTVTGETGQSPEQVRDLVGRHLNRRGWKLDAKGQDCHGAGWALDRTTICVGVHVNEGTVYVSFEGGRAWP